MVAKNRNWKLWFSFVRVNRYLSYVRFCCWEELFFSSGEPPLVLGFEPEPPVADERSSLFKGERSRTTGAELL